MTNDLTILFGAPILVLAMGAFFLWITREKK